MQSGRSHQLKIQECHSSVQKPLECPHFIKSKNQRLHDAYRVLPHLDSCDISDLVINCLLCTPSSQTGLLARPLTCQVYPYLRAFALVSPESRMLLPLTSAWLTPAPLSSLYSNLAFSMGPVLITLFNTETCLSPLPGHFHFLYGALLFPHNAIDLLINHVIYLGIIFIVSDLSLLE